MQLKYIPNIYYIYMYMYPSSPHKNSSKTMENKIEQLGEFNSLILVDVLYRSIHHSHMIVWEIGCGELAAGQSCALGRVMWKKYLPRDTVEPMEAAVRNSNGIIYKHLKLRLQLS